MPDPVLADHLVALEAVPVPLLRLERHPVLHVPGLHLRRVGVEEREACPRPRSGGGLTAPARRTVPVIRASRAGSSRAAWMSSYSMVMSRSTRASSAAAAVVALGVAVGHAHRDEAGQALGELQPGEARRQLRSGLSGAAGRRPPPTASVFDQQRGRPLGDGGDGQRRVRVKRARDDRAVADVQPVVDPAAGRVEHPALVVHHARRPRRPPSRTRRAGAR